MTFVKMYLTVRRAIQGKERHEKHVMHKCISHELYYHIKGVSDWVK